jgi:uncharacterized protein (DUF427 family)
MARSQVGLSEVHNMILEDKIAGVMPFKGIVNILFRGSVIASSENALAARDDQGDVLYFLPFRDVNFELLERRDAAEGEETGSATYWDVVAVGERLPAAVLVYENPPSALRELSAHAAFLSDRLVIDAVTAAEKDQRVTDWPE